MSAPALPPVPYEVEIAELKAEIARLRAVLRRIYEGD